MRGARGGECGDDRADRRDGLVGLSGDGPGLAIDFAPETDHAAGGTDAATKSFIDPGPPYTPNPIEPTDRLTSGGTNGTFSGGVTACTRRFSLRAFTDGGFSTASGGVIDFTKGFIPGTGSGAFALDYGANFAETTRHLTYTVTAADRPDPGLANLTLYGTAAAPEPGA